MDWATYRNLGLDAVPDLHDSSQGPTSVGFEDPRARAAEAKADVRYHALVIDPANKHDSLARGSGVPAGRTIEHKGWAGGTVYPGVQHDFTVYIPAQYDGSEPAALLVRRPTTALGPEVASPAPPTCDACGKATGTRSNGNGPALRRAWLFLCRLRWTVTSRLRPDRPTPSRTARSRWTI
jgi:hypothetical protein